MPGQAQLFYASRLLPPQKNQSFGEAFGSFFFHLKTCEQHETRYLRDNVTTGSNSQTIARRRRQQLRRPAATATAIAASAPPPPPSHRHQHLTAANTKATTKTDNGEQ